MIKHKSNEKSDIYAYQQCKYGNSCSGDSYFIRETDDYLICAVADGLGSGVEAQSSSISAIEAVRAHQDEDVKTIMENCNHSLMHKRGVVIAIFKVYFEKMEVEYSCVGNIRSILYSPSRKFTHPLPMSGFLSGRPQTIKVQNFPIETNTSFIIYSDGLQIKSIKDIVQNLQGPAQVTNEIEKFVDQKPTDDVTFLVGRVS